MRVPIYFVSSFLNTLNAIHKLMPCKHESLYLYTIFINALFPKIKSTILNL